MINLRVISSLSSYISDSSVRFDKEPEFLKTHNLNELSYQTPFTPVLPYITVILLGISIIGIAWDASQRAGLYFGIPFIILCYAYHYWKFKKF